MKINIFRNPFVDTQVGFLIDAMVDARRKETEAYWRETLEKEFQERLDEEYWVGYHNGYNDARALNEITYDCPLTEEPPPAIIEGTQGE